MADFTNHFLYVTLIVLHSVLLSGSSFHGLQSRLNSQLDLYRNTHHHLHRRVYHDRAKRQAVVTATKSFHTTVAESFNGVFFDLHGEFTNQQTFVIESSTADLFTVSQGTLVLKQNSNLDFEKANERSIQLQVLATDQSNVTAVTKITLTILVTNINDEFPVFTNVPSPFLETVSPNAQEGYKVYTLYGFDADPYNDLIYTLDSGDEGRFRIQIESEFVASLANTVKVGVIYTVGTAPFPQNKVYTLSCSVTDRNATQQTTTTQVLVKVGLRVPQFYESQFTGTVRENNGVDQFVNNNLKIQTKSFQNHPVGYVLRTSSNGTSSQFSIDSEGRVKVLRRLDYEAVPRQERPIKYYLNIFATEAVTNLQSSAQLVVEVLDDNDNAPVFELSTYTDSHPENVALNTTVLTVKATDDDSGTNAALVYSVDDDHFFVDTVETTTALGNKEYEGHIKVKKHLDYDRTPGHVYRFSVTAVDKGTPQKTGSASARIFVTNVNDEPPQIIIPDPKIEIREDASIGYPIRVIQTIDLDRDQVNLYFSPQETIYEIFEILPTSGLIRLAATVPPDVDEYTLNITAIDDGSCCPGNIKLTSEVSFKVGIVDINTHKPSFPDCSAYNDNATVLENQPPNTPVIKVTAVDEDRGPNGQVTYSILRSESQNTVYFKVDPNSGQITSAEEFDRERVQFYSVTIRGTDQGTPKLEGYCTFTISIGDVNDNSPKFDLPSYTQTISESYKPGRSIITVRANDDDLGKNAEIEYIMVNSDGGMFRIDRDAGIIYLNKTLGTKTSYALSVMAKDKGQPPKNTTVAVTVNLLNVTSQPPTWDDPNYETNPYLINETAPQGYVVATFRAKSNIADKVLNFALMNTDGIPVQSLGPFRLQALDDRTSVNLTVSEVMDFNIQNKYELRLRVSNRATNPASSMITPVIELIDTNNKIPEFLGMNIDTSYYPGSLAENSPAGTTVAEIKARDADPTSPNNLLSFSIAPNQNASSLFSIKKIDPNTAVLTSTQSFDREETSQYFLDVLVKDGTASSKPNHVPEGTPNSARTTVRIQITDVNDNPPYFEKSFYNQTVREDVPVSASILQVTAKDPDTAAVLTYGITSGNENGAFGIIGKTGVIFAGRPLDYETEQHVYNLTIQVYDGIYNSTTLAQIHIEDANDNSPKFSQDPYIITNVTEEDHSVTPTNKKLLIQVTATDADLARPTQIRYSLLTTGNNNYFEIEADTGKLYLLTSLDRDLPGGRPIYQFNIRAQDEPDPPSGSSDLDRPQFGYASVQVKPIDINDNAPIFSSSPVGSVMEHVPSGTSVMQVVAYDNDAGSNAVIRYSIVKDSPSQVMKFMIEETTGLVRTAVDVNGLDRETTPVYTVKVRASDTGNPPLSTDTDITINIVDINDNKPVFNVTVYKVIMSEAQTSGLIARVTATDKDEGQNARLDYTLIDNLEHFEVVTINNVGVINVRTNQGPDYETDPHVFNLTIVCQDPDPTHVATATVIVTVEDFNDNAPEFNPKLIVTQKYENASIGTFLARFSASDIDSGINAQFTYSIDRKTDPARLFRIDQNGNVTLKNMLDRETQEFHRVFILAIDHGDPAQTGTATLSLTVLDINDNFPEFAKPYHPVVMENAVVVPKLVINLSAKDADAPPFGAPFGFAEPPCIGGCPCADRPTCNDFSMKFISSGDNGQGSAEVSTKRVFDREKQKYYYMPIVMSDMRGTGDPRAQTGTNTLTIEIGDVNDNKHGPGHQDIFVYNYEDLFGAIQIGRVYATDPDDWDLPDKTFTFTGPSHMTKYFEINVDTGMITMKKGVPTTEVGSTNKPHKFTVDVYDKVFGNTETCTVSVTVRDLTQEAVFRSGSVRLKGVTAEEFVKRPKIGTDISAYGASKYDTFRNFLADKISVPAENVDVLSVQNNGQYTDVRFSAHGSPYYAPHSMNAIVAINKAQLEKDLNVTIDQVPIDECKDEMFENGCYNFLNVTNKPAMVNTNGTSFVGVEMFVKAMEGCRAHYYPPADECTPDYCSNGGICKKDDWGELSCQPCGDGFNGPRCQGTHHSFDGQSYALYDPLEQCLESRTSFSFLTEKRQGILLYNGPVSKGVPNEPSDFILVELVDGYPKLTIDHGSGSISLYIDGRDNNSIAMVQEVDDGKWHRIDIIRNGKEVTMILDNCDARLAPDGTLLDEMICRKTDSTPYENVFLNVNTPLQLGGRYPAPGYPAGNNFDGCIKDFMHNGRLYDLYIKEGSYPSGGNTCEIEDRVCGDKCGANGVCEADIKAGTSICICKPGYMGSRPGDTCSYNATIKDLRSQSYFSWQLKSQFYNQVRSHNLKMKTMFRTRDAEGALWKVSSSDAKNIVLKVMDGRLTLQYDMGDGVRELQLYYRHVSNGQWHAATVSRYGKEFLLEMDNGEGPNYNYTLGFPNEAERMYIQQDMNGGAIVSVVGSNVVLNLDLENTCYSDVRMDNKWFALDTNEGTQNFYAAELTRPPQNVDGGCIRDDCANINCPGDRVCYPLWGTHECRCREHYEEVDGQCQPIIYCRNHKCFEGATCEEDKTQDKNYRCICPPDWTSEFCNQYFPQPLQGGLTTGGIIAIVIPLIVLLVLALVVMFFLIRRTNKQPSDDKYVLDFDPDDDIRENVINYDEEGAGEEDQDGYDMNRLRTPNAETMLPPVDFMPRREEIPRRNAPGESPDVGNFINGRLGDADDDNDAPPVDIPHEFAYEGDGSDAGSLSSLQTSSSTSSQDYDYLNNWGPKFAKLADMYGAGAGAGEEEV